MFGSLRLALEATLCFAETFKNSSMLILYKMPEISVIYENFDRSSLPCDLKNVNQSSPCNIKPPPLEKISLKLHNVLAYWIQNLNQIKQNRKNVCQSDLKTKTSIVIKFHHWILVFLVFCQKDFLWSKQVQMAGLFFSIFTTLKVCWPRSDVWRWRDNLLPGISTRKRHSCFSYFGFEIRWNNLISWIR